MTFDDQSRVDALLLDAAEHDDPTCTCAGCAYDRERRRVRSDYERSAMDEANERAWAAHYAREREVERALELATPDPRDADRMDPRAELDW